MSDPLQNAYAALRHYGPRCVYCHDLALYCLIGDANRIFCATCSYRYNENEVTRMPYFDVLLRVTSEGP